MISTLGSLGVGRESATGVRAAVVRSGAVIVESGVVKASTPVTLLDGDFHCALEGNGVGDGHIGLGPLRGCGNGDLVDGGVADGDSAGFSSSEKLPKSSRNRLRFLRLRC